MAVFLENNALPILSINSEGICALIRQECSLMRHGDFWVPPTQAAPFLVLCPQWHVFNFVVVSRGILRVLLCSVTHDPWRPPWTLICQALLSVGFLSQQYQSELPFPSPGDLLHPGIKSISSPHPPRSPTLQADSLPLSHWGSPS